MTAKDFILIASIINSLPAEARDAAAQAFAESLASTNSRFDKERFLTACLV